MISPFVASLRAWLRSVSLTCTPSASLRMSTLPSALHSRFAAAGDVPVGRPMLSSPGQPLRRPRLSRWVGGLLVLGSVALLGPTPLRAQDPVYDRLVRVIGPKSVVVDSTTKVAKIQLYNPTADTAVVDVYLQFAVPGDPRPQRASALLSEDSVVEDSLQRARERDDSREKLWSLESWVQEPLPVRLWLAPRQTVMLPVHVQVPSTAQPGKHSVHVVIATATVVDQTALVAQAFGSLLGPVGGGKAYRIIEGKGAPQNAVQLIYPVGPTAQ